MTIRPIVIHGDPVLHNPTEPVTEAIDSPELQELIADMHETMDAAHGVGLAANQVGVNKRLFVYHCPDTDGPDGTELPEGGMRRGCVINPVRRPPRSRRPCRRTTAPRTRAASPSRARASPPVSYTHLTLPTILLV